jgi:hypothetical protein
MEKDRPVFCHVTASDRGAIGAVENASVVASVAAADSGTLTVRSSVAIMKISRHAQAWYEDALREARAERRKDHQARRREIVFAVCCGESYLYEWTYDLLAQAHPYPDRDEVVAHLLPDRMQGEPLTARWNKVPKNLQAAGFLARTPSYRPRDHAKKWEKLVLYRNGLVHAHISQPEYGPAPSERPSVTTEDLLALPPGWAVNVVAERIRRLHDAAGTPPPDWLVRP